MVAANCGSRPVEYAAPPPPPPPVARPTDPVGALEWIFPPYEHPSCWASSQLRSAAEGERWGAAGRVEARRGSHGSQGSPRARPSPECGAVAIGCCCNRSKVAVGRSRLEVRQAAAPWRASRWPRRDSRPKWRGIRGAAGGGGGMAVFPILWGVCQARPRPHNPPGAAPPRPKTPRPRPGRRAAALESLQVAARRSKPRFWRGNASGPGLDW